MGKLVAGVGDGGTVCTQYGSFSYTDGRAGDSGDTDGLERGLQRQVRGRWERL